MKQAYTEDDVVEMIKRLVKMRNQKLVAKTFHISTQYLNDILKGRRKISERIAKKFGFKKGFYREI